ncbi:hypothetical protein [Streptomyces sp. WM6386]|uniref:hypothetical protein n=1 Tax=Streptomyces sp. WM6386 TaxID=1415558 RepID=UPI0006191CDF|nr:hypothetical protein [Streptomyces sp. WM6386]KKD03891.1 hypothetical protein TN53_32930 [Streptomyces sp. WM6386]
MDIGRTPDERFDDLRMHDVDEGQPDGLVPELMGFGRSDKPVDRAAYTYESHVACTGEWLDQLGLADITLFADPPASMLSRAWAGLSAFEKPFLTTFAAHEDITRAFEQVVQEHIPGARDRSRPTVPDAGHFLQQQQPDLLVEAILSLA